MEARPDYSSTGQTISISEPPPGVDRIETDPPTSLADAHQADAPLRAVHEALGLGPDPVVGDHHADPAPLRRPDPDRRRRRPSVLDDVEQELADDLGVPVTSTRPVRIALWGIPS